MASPAWGRRGILISTKRATESARLETSRRRQSQRPAWSVDATDWPTFRANNQGTVTAAVPLRAKAKLLWEYAPKTAYTPSAPTAADTLAFVSGSDGVDSRARREERQGSLGRVHGR